MTKEEFSQKLKNARTLRGLTQAQVADAIDRPQQTVGGWEVGRSQPDINTLSQLLRLYGLDANDFFEFAPLGDRLSLDETEQIKKYRTLDQHGKELVRMILDKECQRTLQALPTPPKTAPALTLFAAFTGDNCEAARENADLVDRLAQDQRE